MRARTGKEVCKWEVVLAVAKSVRVSGQMCAFTVVRGVVVSNLYSVGEYIHGQLLYIASMSRMCICAQ